MSSFSPGDAAFEGFRLTRERPRAVLAWAACGLLFIYLIGVVGSLTLGPQSQALLADYRRASGDPAAFWPAARSTAPFFLAGLPLGLAFQAIIISAIYRVVLRPAESTRGYLRVGANELRMMALSLIMSVVWGVILFAVSFVAVFMAMTFGAADAGAPLIGFAVTMAVLCLAIVILVRLSLAGPMTFGEQRLRVFESWSLTKGCFWRLLAAYAMTLALGAVALALMLLILLVVAAVIFQFGGVTLASINTPSPAPLIIVFAFIWQVATVLIFTCFYVVLKAPAAQIYKDLMSGAGAVAAD